MQKQVSPAVAVIVIIIVLAILAGIWYMIYGRRGGGEASMPEGSMPSMEPGMMPGGAGEMPSTPPTGEPSAEPSTTGEGT
jgi:hypothetical protein